jgi:signal transduction histidine kinase
LSSLELEELKKILARNMPGLGISDSFIYLFDTLTPYLGQGKPPRDGRLFFHQINQNAAFGIGKTDFPNKELISRLDLADKGNYLILPLFMDQEIFGIVGFRCQYFFFDLYDNVRAYISAAVKGGTLLSDQKRSREALASSHKSVMEKSQELEIANRAKDMFLSNMSHEIRTPLNAILGFTDLLLVEESDAVKKGYLEAILDGGKTLLGIVNTVLELSRIEAGRIEIKQQETAFKKLIGHIVTNHNSKSRNQNFQIDSDLGGLDSYSLFIDENKVIRVVSSILAAALGMNESGKVLLECRTKATAHDRCTIEISVKNHDDSANEDRVVRVFEPFSKYGETMIVEELDSGLTLALSRKIATAMKGDLTCSIHIWPDGTKGMNFFFSMWDVLFFDSSSLPVLTPSSSSEIPVPDRVGNAILLSEFELEMLRDILNHYPNVKKEYFLIDDISGMAEEMTKTARRLALKGMQDFTDRLLSGCNDFDLGKIRELLAMIAV